MSVSIETLLVHLDYHAWASRRLVEAAAQLSVEELTRDFKTSDRSVLDTLVHVYAADRLWLRRMEGLPFAGYSSDADRSLAVLQNDWPALMERWKEWTSRRTGETASAPFTYSDLKGRTWTQPIWQLILHVVNHGTHHRGQTAGFLRSMGHVPPPLDLVFYYRER
ncbi:MAG TPA: DinB family protein [Bryobacteraceae bacterium]|nr:DinB family protein [Bryobacteraceae bacterium]